MAYLVLILLIKRTFSRISTLVTKHGKSVIETVSKGTKMAHLGPK